MGGWRVLGNEEEVLIVHTLADVSNEAAAADAAFIAEARTALPACLDAIEALNAAVEGAREAIEINLGRLEGENFMREPLAASIRVSVALRAALAALPPKATP
jgi:hypothetical protein